jgi:hypothetical protein
MIRNFDGNIKLLTDIHKPLTDQLAFVGVKLQISHQYTHYSPDLLNSTSEHYYIIPHGHSYTQYATNNSSICILITRSVSISTLKLCAD